MQLEKKPTPALNGSRLKVGIAVARFNQEITDTLLASAQAELARAGVAPEHITVYSVPGSVELPFALQKLALAKKYDCLVAIGCIIKGETSHFDYVCKMAQEGILRVSLDQRIPIGFGIITANNLAQAQVRPHFGSEAVRAAIELALL